MRYATKACVIDGKNYNQGDIVPEGVGDVETLNRLTRVEGESPAPKTAAQIRAEMASKPEDKLAPEIKKEIDETLEKGPDSEEKVTDELKFTVDDLQDAAEKGIVSFDPETKFYSYGDLELGTESKAAVKAIRKAGLTKEILDAIK